MGYGISVWKSPFSILLQVRLQDSFLTSNKQPRSDTCSSDLPQQKTGSGCRINKKKNISLSSGELSFSQHITRCCVMTELQNNTNMSAASILPRRKTGQKCFEGFGKKKVSVFKRIKDKLWFYLPLFSVSNPVISVVVLVFCWWRRGIDWLISRVTDSYWTLSVLATQTWCHLSVYRFASGQVSTLRLFG